MISIPSRSFEVIILIFESSLIGIHVSIRFPFTSPAIATLASPGAISAAISAVELGHTAGPAGDIGPLRQKVEAEPNNPEARFNLAMGHFDSGQHDAAIDELLELIRINRNWNEEAGRVQLLKVFDTLGSSHELTISGRKRLSSILFS